MVCCDVVGSIRNWASSDASTAISASSSGSSSARRRRAPASVVSFAATASATARSEQGAQPRDCAGHRENRAPRHVQRQR